MALPLWDECSWLKAITTVHHKRRVEEKAKIENDIAQKQKEEEDAELFRKTLEKNEKLLKLTSALLTTSVPSSSATTEENKKRNSLFVDESDDTSTFLQPKATAKRKSDPDRKERKSLFDEEGADKPEHKEKAKHRKSIFGDDDDQPQPNNQESKPKDEITAKAKARKSLFGDEDEVIAAAEATHQHNAATKSKYSDLPARDNEFSDESPESSQKFAEHQDIPDIDGNELSKLTHHLDLTDKVTASLKPLTESTATNSDEPLGFHVDVGESDGAKSEVKTESSHNSAAHHESSNVPSKPEIHYPFSINEDINSKIYLYCGAGYKVPCNVLIVGQNESLTDRYDDNAAIINLAGPTLEEELAAAAPIQTGEAVITTGGTMPCEAIIHAVGPKFDERYLIASDHALHSAYKAALFLALEQGSRDLVITCIYSKRKKYPRFEAAHVALRTVRKFLDHFHPSHGSIGQGVVHGPEGIVLPALPFQRIMFCVPLEEDYEIYATLLSAYFPRNPEELAESPALLPKAEELGDAWGEIKLEERVLKVSAGPKPLPKDAIQQYRAQREQNEATGAEGDNHYEDLVTSQEAASRKRTGDKPIVPVGVKVKGMNEITHDDDEKRQKKIKKELKKMSREDRLKLRFQVLLEDIDLEPLDDLAEMNFLNFVGKDEKNRTVVIINAANFKTNLVDHERVILYFMKIMEAFRCRPFVLIYAVSNMTEENTPDASLVQDIFDLFTARYCENMQQLYILHASFMFRMYIWIALPFLTTPFWSKYICASKISDLKPYMDIHEIAWPQAILDYDRTL